MRNVIFEAIERALAAFEIADYLYVSEFGKLIMLGDAAKLPRSPSSPLPTWKAIW